MTNVRHLAPKSNAQEISGIIQQEAVDDPGLELVVLSVKSNGNFHVYWTSVSSHLKVVGMLAQVQANLMSMKFD